MSSAFERRMGNPDKGVAGRKNESKTAKRFGGRAQPGSGSLLGAKGDIRTTDFLLECKSTTGLSMGLKHDWLIKIASEARAQNRKAALSITFVQGDGRPIKDGAWVLVPESVWQEVFQDD